MAKRLNGLQRTILLATNARFARFPHLTRPMLASRRFEERLLTKQATFSDDLLRRICECHERAVSGARQDMEDLWTELTKNNQQFLSDLKERNIGSLRRSLQGMYHGPLLVGMAHTAAFLGSKPHYSSDYFSLRCRDSILALAEATGLRGVMSNHQTPLGDYVESINADLTDAIAGLETLLGHSIETPDVGKPPVAIIGRYNINPDFVRHAYVPWRLNQLGLGKSALVEIGGGFGCVARFAVQSGCPAYTIVDLPHINAIQMAFLGASMGDDVVSGYGEAPARIRLMPSSRKAEAFDGAFGAAINMDSLPEINLNEAQEYLDLISRNCGYFLSVNQEAKKLHKGKLSQHSVPELVLPTGNFKRLHRHPYWMQQGYVEELYQSTRKA